MSNDGTVADISTRCAVKIKDPFLGPWRVDVKAPGEGFGLEGTPTPKIQRDPSPPKRKPYMWAAAVLVTKCEDTFALALCMSMPMIHENVNMKSC